MVATGSSSLATPLLEPVQRQKQDRKQDIFSQVDSSSLLALAEPHVGRVAPALPPLAPTGSRQPASAGSATADALGIPQACDSRQAGQALPRPGIEQANQLPAKWYNVDRRPKEWPRDERSVAIQDRRLEQQEAQTWNAEVAYQVDFPSHILSEFRLVSNGRLITEIDDGDAEVGGSISALPSQAPWNKRLGRMEYARVFSSDSFSIDLALALLRTGIATASLFMNAAVLLAISGSTPAARTVKYLLGCACAISAVTQLGVAGRVVREELPDESAEASRDPHSGSLWVWSSRMIFVLVGVPRRVKNVIVDIHPCRHGAGGSGVAALQDQGSQVFITCHSSACEFRVLDAHGQESMTPVQLCMAVATTLCKLLLACLEPGFGAYFLLLSIIPSSTSIARDALSIHELNSERKQFRELLLRRHSSSRAHDRRLAASLLKDHFGEIAKEELPASEAGDRGRLTSGENTLAVSTEKTPDDVQLRQTCWELVKEMQTCLDTGDPLPNHLQAARDRLTHALLSRPATAANNTKDHDRPTHKMLTKVRESPMLTKALLSDQAKLDSPMATGELPDDLEAVCERFAVAPETVNGDGDASDPGTLTLTRSSRGADITPAIIYSGTNNSSLENLHEPICYEEDRDDFTSLSASMATFATNDERASSHVLALEREDLALQLHAARDALAQEVCAGAELRTQLANAQLELKDYQTETDRLLSHLKHIDHAPLQRPSSFSGDGHSTADSIPTLASRGLSDRLDKIISEEHTTSMLFGQSLRTPMTSEASVATRMKDMRDLMNELTVDDAAASKDAVNSMSTLPPEGFSSNGTMPQWSEPFAEAWKRLASLRSTLSSGDANVGVPEVGTANSLTASGDAAAGSCAIHSEAGAMVHTSTSETIEAATSATSECSKQSPTLSSRMSPVLSTRQSPSLSTRSARYVDGVDPPEVSLEQVMLGENLRRRTEPAPRIFSLMSQVDRVNVSDIAAVGQSATATAGLSLQPPQTPSRAVTPQRQAASVAPPTSGVSGPSVSAAAAAASMSQPPSVRINMVMAGTQPGSMVIPMVQQQLRSPQQAQRSTFPYKPTVALAGPWGAFNPGLKPSAAGGKSNATTPTMINREITMGAAQFSTQPYSPALPVRQVSAPLSALSPRNAM